VGGVSLFVAHGNYECSVMCYFRSAVLFSLVPKILV